MKYRKKPVVIEAVRIPAMPRFDGVLLVFLKDAPATVHDAHVSIKTLEGTMTGSVGDYIIKGVKGEFYPCKSAIFDATYEQIAEKDDLG